MILGVQKNSKGYLNIMIVGEFLNDNYNSITINDESFAEIFTDKKPTDYAIKINEEGMITHATLQWHVEQQRKAQEVAKELDKKVKADVDYLAIMAGVDLNV